MCNRMPFIDLRQHKEGFALVQTIRKNFEGFTKKQIEKAILAREAQAMMGHPPDVKFKQLVSSNSVKNCRVKVSDVTNARIIFGPNLDRLGGATTRQQPVRVEAEYIGIPRDIYERHMLVTLTADVMFVNGIAFLVTLSRDIRLFSCEHVPSRTAKQLSNSFKKNLWIYARGGFKVRTIMMDMEFEKVKDQLGMVEVNTTAAREHVGEIERGIRFVKERARCVVTSAKRVGIHYLHKQIVIRLVYFVTMCINSVPTTLGVSRKYSPREIVTQNKFDFALDCRVKFLALVEASTDAIITNDMIPRTHKCLALGPSGNLQGSVMCFDLDTGKVVTRRTIKEIPMPESVIKRVNKWGTSKRGKEFNGTIEFLNRTRDKFEWENEDISPSEETGEQPPLVHPSLTAEVPGILLESDFEDIQPAIEEVIPPTHAERAVSARQNMGLEKRSDQTSKIPGVSQSAEVTQSTGLVPGDNPSTYNIDDAADSVDPPKLVETIYDDDSDDSDDSDYVPDDVSEGSDDSDCLIPPIADDYEDDSDDEDEPPITPDAVPVLGGGRRIRKPPQNYVPTLTGQGQRYTEGVINLSHEDAVAKLKRRMNRVTEGVNFHGFHGRGHKLSEEDMLMNSHTGAGYAQKGVVFLDLNAVEPPEVPQSEEELDDHLLGIVLAHHF